VLETVAGLKMLPFAGLRVNNADVYGVGTRLNADLEIRMFRPHANLCDQINHNIVQSEIDGGVFLSDLKPRTILFIQTQHHVYTAVVLKDNQALLWGHPTFCPRPVPVSIAGSTWGGSMLKSRFVGRGMRLEFHHPGYSTPIITSPIQAINERPSCVSPKANRALVTH
jgi:hypothetical protein